MPRVPVHDLDSAPEASRHDLKVLKTRRGRILNIFGGMAHAPTLLALYMAAGAQSPSTPPWTARRGRRST